MTTLYHTIKRLANEVPETRSVLVPLLRTLSAGCEKLPEGGMRDNCEKKQKGKTEEKKEARFISEVEEMISKFAAAPSYKDYVEKKRKQNKKPLSKDEWERKVLKTGPANQPKKDEGGKKKDEGAASTGGSSEIKKVFNKALSVPGLGDLTSGMPKEFLSKNEGYSHPAVKKLQKKLLDKLTPDQVKTLKNEIGKAHLEMNSWIGKQPGGVPTKLPQDAQDAHAQLISVWRAVSDLDPKEAKGKGGGKGKEKAKSYKKSYPKPATSIMDKHSLTDDDADQVKNFKKGKPKAGVELTPAQLMQKFLAKAKPETKERMKDMSPADFVKLLGVLTDDEGAEG